MAVVRRGKRVAVFFRVLDTFKRQGIKAIINVCGILAERYPDIVRRIHDEGLAMEPLGSHATFKTERGIQ